MKRIINLLIILSFTFLFSNAGFAQTRDYGRNYKKNNIPSGYSYTKNQIEFKRLVGEFRIAAELRDFSAMRSIKEDILRTMRREVQTTEADYRAAFRQQDRLVSAAPLYRKSGGIAVANRYGKNYTVRNHSTEAQRLERKLNTQKLIASQFQQLNQGYHTNYGSLISEHERLMREFSRTLGYSF